MKHLLAIVTLFLTCSMAAQSDPDGMISAFFSTYSKGEVDKAIDDLYDHSPWMKGKSDAITGLKSQISSFASIAGEYRGYALLGTSSLQTDLTIYDYIVKYDRQPLRFRFQFYRPDKVWTVYSFAFDDDLGDELEEVVKSTYYHP